MAVDTQNLRNEGGHKPTLENLKITSRNVDGLRDELKRKKLFLLLKSSPDDIILLQETHCTPEMEPTWTNDWDGPIIFSNGTSSKRGVAILFKSSCNLTPSDTLKDDQGRYIITNIPMVDHSITIINLYGPNEDSPTFFQNIISHLENTETCKYIIDTNT